MDPSDAVLVVGIKAVVTLLPLIPAYVLFATLKSQARVSGPLSGFKVQLSGSFAAYFVVLLVLWQGLAAEIEKSHYHTWTVTVEVKFVSSGQPPDYGQIVSYMRPPELPVQKDGTFEFQVPVRVLPNGNLEWPQLSMEVPGFEPGIIHLYEPSRKPAYGTRLLKEDYDKANRAIALKEPVVIRAKTESKPYDPTKAEKPVLLTANPSAQQ